MGRAALGNHQGQHFAQGQAFVRQALGIRGIARQGFVGLVEVGAVPHPQSLCHAMDFTVARHRRQRHAIEVVAHHVLPGLERLRPILVGAHGGGNHLANLFPARHGQPVG
ncbi:hypothetical protein D3C78_1638260 [compost metagenome]